MIKKFRKSPAVPASCWQCPVKDLTLCQPLKEERLSIVQTFKKGDRILPAGSQLFRPGEVCPELYNLLDGWGALYQVLESGDWQILGFALPGAFLGQQPHLDAPMLYGVECLTDVAVCVFPRREFPKLIKDHPDLAIRLAQLNIQATVLAYDHLTNIGSRSARARVAHLLLDLCLRLRGGQLSEDDNEIDIPLTQHHIADALGLTSVYVSQTLKQLREQNLLLFKNGRLQILDPDGLANIAEVAGLNLIELP